MTTLEKAGRIGQVLIGLVFIVAGGVKVWEPVLFYWQALPYAEILGVDKENMGTLARWALLLGPAEVAVGLALILNWRPRWTMPVASALMAFFTILTFRAWRQGASVDCGCFGTLVDRSPGEAALEDTLFLAVLGFSWWALRGLAPSTASWRTGGLIAGAVLAMVVSGVRFFPHEGRLQNSDLQVGVRLTGLGFKGEQIDLSEGEHLLEIFSPTCGRCQKAVPKLNEWVDHPGLPPILALNSYTEDSYQLQQFRQRFKPRYQIATISRTDLARLLWGSPGYPRLAHVRDGVVQAVWEHNEVPSLEEMVERFGGTAPN